MSVRHRDIASVAVDGLVKRGRRRARLQRFARCMYQFDHLRADGTMLCLLFERNFIRADAVELGGEFEQDQLVDIHHRCGLIRSRI